MGISPGPPPRAPQPWWFKHVTLDRLLLIGVLLINGGRWWQGQQNTNETLAERLDKVVVRLDAADATYARKDVLEVQLQAISAQITDLKATVQKGGAR